MNSGPEWTRQRLRNSLNRDLKLYARYVPNPNVLAEYLESTKQALLAAVTDVFNEKIEEVKGLPVDKPPVPIPSRK